MSGHHITMIASGMDRLSTSNVTAQATAVLKGPFAITLPSKRIFVLSGTQTSVKMAEAA